MRLVAYCRVSTGKQGNGSDAQLADIRGEASRRGWNLIAEQGDVASGRSRKRRPGLAAAVAACKAGEADGIVAAKLDRLCRSSTDFSDLLREAQEYGFTLVVLDFNIDTSTATGRLIADIIARIGEWEREVIGERTSAALTELRASGRWDPRVIDQATRRRIVREFKDGRAILAIVRGLNEDAAASAPTGRWHKETVNRVLRQELGIKKGPLARSRTAS